MSEQEKQLETTKETKDKPAKKKDKPGFFARVARWFREMKSELKKVQWPTWKQTWNNTLTVIVCVILIGLFIWVFDWVAHNVVMALLNLAGKG